MKDKFSEYYALSEDEVKKDWKESIVVLDTNVLLDLYRYTDETRKSLLDLLDKINYWGQRAFFSNILKN